MPRISRKTFKSGFYHIIIQGLNKEYIFNKNENKEKYLYLMKKYYPKYKIKIVSYTLMDNHAHFIIYSENIENISAYMHKINFIYAIDYNKNNKRVGYVFRDRYKSQYIYDRDYLFKCIKYIHLNPVKANLVNTEQDYKFSSYNDFKNKTGFVDNELIKLVFKNEDNYMTLFNSISDIDIEIMDIEEEDYNFEIAVQNYLKRNKVQLEKIKESKILLYSFSSELLSKGYKQNRIAKKLEVSPSQISKMLRKNKYP